MRFRKASQKCSSCSEKRQYFIENITSFSETAFKSVEYKAEVPLKKVYIPKSK